MESFGENDEVADFGTEDAIEGSATQPKTSLSNWTRAWNQVKQGPTDILALPHALYESTIGERVDPRPVASRKIGQQEAPDELLSENFRQKRDAYDTRRGMMPDRQLLDLKRGIDTHVMQADPSMPAPDKGTLARYAGTTGRVVSGNLIPGGAVTVMARPGLKLLTAGTELAASTGSGVAGEFGSQIAPSLGLDPSVTGAAASLVGGVGASALTKPLVRATKAGIDKTKSTMGMATDPESIKAKVATGITKIVDVDPASQANLTRATDISEKVPGFKPILANATGSKFLTELTRARARIKPELDRKLVTTMESNKAAIEKFKDQAFPPGKVPDPTSPARQKYYKTMRDLEKNIEDVDARLETLADNYRFASSADIRKGIGSELRDLHARRRAAVKSIAEGKYKDVYAAADAAKVTVDADAVKTYINGIVSSRPNAFQGKDMPAVFQDVLEYGQKQMPFEEFHSLWKRTNKEFRLAQRSGDANKIRFLSEFKDQLDSQLAKFEGSEFGAVGERLRDANAFYKKYDKTFKKGLGGELVATNRFGHPMTADEHVVHSLIMNPRKGSTQLDDFLEIYSSPIDGVESAGEAQKLLRDGVIDVFANEVVRNGKIKPASVESFIRKYDHVLSRLPDVKRELMDTDVMNDALMSRMRDLQSRKTKMGQTVIARIANVEPSQVDDFLYRNIGNQKVLSKLTASVASNPEARKSMVRSIVDTFTRGQNGIDFFFKNKATLKPFLDKLAPGHFDNVETIVRANAMNTNISPSNVDVPPVNIDPLQESIGTSARGVSNILNAMRQGRSGMHDVISFLGSRFVFKMRAAEAEKIIDEALFDPDVAKTLADIARKEAALPKRTTKGAAGDAAKFFGKLVTEDLEKHLFTLGLRGVTFIGQDVAEETP